MGAASKLWQASSIGEGNLFYKPLYNSVTLQIHEMLSKTFFHAAQRRAD